MNWLLRLFGVRDERVWPTYKCPTCGHEREISPTRSAQDAFLNGASMEWFEAALERELLSEVSSSLGTTGEAK